MMVVCRFLLSGDVVSMRWAGLPAPWLSLWESWHGVAVTERAYAVANMEKAS